MTQPFETTKLASPNVTTCGVHNERAVDNVSAISSAPLATATRGLQAISASSRMVRQRSARAISYFILSDATTPGWRFVRRPNFTGSRRPALFLQLIMCAFRCLRFSVCCLLSGSRRFPHAFHSAIDPPVAELLLLTDSVYYIYLFRYTGPDATLARHRQVFQPTVLLQFCIRAPRCRHFGPSSTAAG